MNDMSEILERQKKVFQEVVRVCAAKGGDYGNNLFACENLGVPAELGILIRITDKVSRMANLISTGDSPRVPESMLDTATDLVGYAGLLAAIISLRTDGGGGDGPVSLGG